MHMTISTFLSTIIFTSLASARSRYTRGSVENSLLRKWVSGILIGALGGGHLDKFVNVENSNCSFRDTNYY